MGKDDPVEYVDRRTGRRTVETVMGDRALRFAYRTMAGRLLWPLLFGGRTISALLGRKFDSPSSAKKIPALASLPGCNPGEAEKPVSEYATFNEFFTRRLKPGARPVGDGVTSPADGRISLHLGADAGAPFPLKGAKRALRDVFAPSAPPGAAGGLFDIAVVRLAPVDYHRFHFPCDCSTPEPPVAVPGTYHSVNPLAVALRPDVYAMNERQILRCETAFGDMWLVEVGAFGVGTICQTFSGTKHAKGEEKGYFKFGGSTVIMATRAGALEFDADIAANSAQGLETKVLCGERIAVPAARK